MPTFQPHIPDASDALRLTQHVGIPLQNAESFSMTRYRRGQNYGLHFDSGYHEGNGSIVQRIYTGIVFLNSPLAGGELIFPGEQLIAGNYPSIEKVCSKEHGLANQPLIVAPQAGLAVFFQNHVRANGEWGEREPASLHGACPVKDGEKWILQLWMRGAPQGFW